MLDTKGAYAFFNMSVQILEDFDGVLRDLACFFNFFLNEYLVQTDYASYCLRRKARISND